MNHKPMRALLLLFLAAVATRAQPAGPRIGYVFPAGGQRGSTVEVVVGGQFLDGVTNVYLSGQGIAGAVIASSKPLTQQQINALRERLKELQDRKSAARRPAAGTDSTRGQTNAVWTPTDEQLLSELRQRLANAPRRQANPAIGERVTVRLTIDDDAALTPRELRLGTPNGITNPLRIEVGQLPEFTEVEPSSASEATARRPAAAPAPRARDPELAITLPAVVNGQILAGDVDHCRFHARKGQRIVIAVSARSLMPYLADAVPGWFQATLALTDTRGRELAFADDYRFKPDPVLSYDIPEDGDYRIEIRDAIYRGREDFVYRISLGELPFITGIFPLGARAGTTAMVECSGWNLPIQAVERKIQGADAHVEPLSIQGADGVSNWAPLAVDTLPEMVETEPNNLRASAEPVVLPVIANGRINAPGDWDLYRFEGRQGDRVVLEVLARRLDSPLDSILKLTDANGTPIALNDDWEDRGSGLNTHHADSYLDATLPAHGTFVVHIGDTQHKGSSAHAYRLRIGPPRPDFAVRVVPSSLSARPGTTISCMAYVFRKDGFNGDVTLRLNNAPRGFALGGPRIPAGVDEMPFTITVPPAPIAEPVALAVEARAQVQGSEQVRRAVPADDMMQAFAYRHLVPAQDLRVAVWGRPTFRTGAWRVLSGTPVRIPAGGTATLRIGGGPGAPRAGVIPTNVTFALSEPPEGVTLQRSAAIQGGAELVLAADPQVKAGLQGNLLLEVLQGRPAAGGAPVRRDRRRGPVLMLPAVPFEIPVQ